MAFHSRFLQVDGSDTDPVEIMGAVFGDGKKDGTGGRTEEAADGALHRCVEFEWEGMLFTVTDSNEVAAVVEDGTGGWTEEAADGALHRCVGFKWEGMLFTVTDNNEVAAVVKDGKLQVLGSESYVEAGTGTRQHWVDVQGDREAMLLFVSVREDERRIVSIRRFS